MERHSSAISRRKVLLLALQGVGAMVMTGCENIFNQLHGNKRVLSLLESAEGLNLRVQRLLTGRDSLAQEFNENDISRYFKSNGNPPPLTIEYIQDALSGWPFWRLEVAGLVNNPQQFSLYDLKSLPSRTQITRHDCVEGWSAIAKWKGVPLSEVLRRVQPKAEARYVIFLCMDADRAGSLYYESIDLHDATHPQTILAYEMNDQLLPIEHGAPLRLRVETQLGYKMAKYILRLELVASYRGIGKGKGGYWQDQGYAWYAGI